MTAATAARRRDERAPSVTGRLAGALPVVTVFAWAALAYAWQGWLLRSAWLFLDELEYTELARSLAAVHEPLLRGEPASLPSLAPVLMAPAWLAGDVSVGYELAKLTNVVVMSAAAFPAYALARTVAGRAPALLAAAASVAVPAFMYSAMLLEEPLAYTWFTLFAYLTVRATSERRPRWVAAAAAAAAVAPLTRGQLVVAPAILALALVGSLWMSAGDEGRPERDRRRRRVAAGVAALALVGAGLAAALAASDVGRVALRDDPGGAVVYAGWALGAFTIGVGLLPVVVAGALLAGGRRDRRPAATTSFLLTLAASLLALVAYAGAKGAYLEQLVGQRYVLERNVVYAAPLVFAALALWLDRPRLRALPAALSALAVGALVAWAPIRLEYPYWDAPGYGILVAGNRHLRLDEGDLRTALLVAWALAALAVLAPVALRNRTPARTALVVVGVAVLAWNVAGQVTASGGSRAFGERMRAAAGEPPDWVDEATGRSATLYVGAEILDANAVHALEFWNRSIVPVWSVDGTAPGPGPAGRLLVAAPDGTVALDPGARYVLTDAPLEVVGPLVAARGRFRLYRVASPLRVRSTVLGVYADGWMGPGSAYDRYDVDARGGRVEVTIGREGWGGPDVPGTAVVRVGPLGLDAGSAFLAATTATRRVPLRAGRRQVVRLPAPGVPFRVEVTAPTFVPAELQAGNGDGRALGAQVAFGYVPSAAP